MSVSELPDFESGNHRSLVDYPHKDVDSGLLWVHLSTVPWHEYGQMMQVDHNPLSVSHKYMHMYPITVTLHERQCVSNYGQMGCLFNVFFKLITRSVALLNLCERNP